MKRAALRKHGGFLYSVHSNEEDSMPESPSHPMAMPPSVTPITPISKSLMAATRAASHESPRKRMIFPLHKHGGDSLQRMLNALQPGSYIRPHRHAPDRGESIVVLAGSILYLVFNSEGDVQEHWILTAGSAQLGIDIEGGIWHCFMALEPDTILFEVKPGPYDALADKDFASWAPEEYSEEAATYLEALKSKASC
jgi:cupin fold WbuC family metalloprotein